MLEFPFDFKPFTDLLMAGHLLLPGLR